MKEEHIGSGFDEFLAQEKLLADCEARALERVVVWQLAKEMKRRRISRTALAGRMKAPRTVVDRLFTQNDSAVSLRLLERAASPWGESSRSK